ncbi:MAG: TIR domain-containing protein [Candidatus Thiodiazotropha sp.]
MNEDDSIIEERTYWAFLSYRHTDNLEQDREWASWLHRELERYDIPAELVGKRNHHGSIVPERLFPVFRDEEELPADSSLRDVIRSALDKSSSLIVLCSPRAVKSQYVADEIEYFINLGKGDRIIPAIVAGEPGDEKAECFPAPLRHIPVAKISDDNLVNQPLAADFRLPDGTEGFTSTEAYRRKLETTGFLSRNEVERLSDDYEQKCQLAKLKIIAGVLGVGLDDLRHRDKAYRLAKEKKRTRVLRRWLVVVVSLGFAALTLAFVANTLRVESERARSDAEELVAFLQDDAQSALKRLGRLDIMEELNQAIFDYLDRNEDSTNGLRQRVSSKSKYDQAALYLKIGRTSEAKKLFQEAITNSKTAAELRDQPAWLDVAAVSAYKYAEILYNDDRADDALRYLNEASQLADAVLTIEPNNPKAQTARYGQSSIVAAIQTTQGEHDAALKSLSEVDVWFEGKRTKRGHAEFDHISVLLQLSRIANTAERNQEALVFTQRALKLADELVSGEQQDRGQVLARLQMAMIEQLSGNYSSAAIRLDEAVVIVSRRLSIDNQSQEWILLAIDVTGAFADVKAQIDDYDAMIEQLRQRTAYARRLHNMDPTSPTSIQIFIDSLMDEALVQRRMSDMDLNEQLLIEAREVLRFAKEANIKPVSSISWLQQLAHVNAILEDWKK